MKMMEMINWNSVCRLLTEVNVPPKGLHTNYSSLAVFRDDVTTHAASSSSKSAIRCRQLFPYSIPFYSYNSAQIVTMRVSILCLILSLVYVDAFSSLTSAFGGKVLLFSTSCQTQNHRGHGCQLEMKKGKSNVPPHMRGQYKRMEELSKVREQMMDAQRPGPDGLPVFNLYVRSPRANMWYPCGSFKGDNRSQALCTSIKDNGWLSSISKDQLDSGIAGSLWRDQDKLKETIVRVYPQLRETRDTLEFGYKVGFEGLSEEQLKIQAIVPKEQKGLLDNIKDKVSTMFSSE